MGDFAELDTGVRDWSIRSEEHSSECAAANVDDGVCKGGTESLCD